MTVQSIPARMLSARFHGNQDVRVDEVENLPLCEGEVRIKVAFAGICGSDLHEFYDGPATCRAPGCPHPLTGQTHENGSPLGHENSGTVVEVHPSLSGTDYAARFPVGTRVVMEPVISCRKCPPCLAGDRGLCEAGIAFYGYNSESGGLSHFMNVRAEHLHKVPDNISLDVAALAEPLAVAWHAVGRSNFKEGETALVIGAGPIGALVTRVLKAKGASFVAVSEPSEARAGIAKACGADLVLNPIGTDVPAAVKAANGGRGVHVAIDCAGTQRTLDAAVAATGVKGRIVEVALMDGRFQLDVSAFLFLERTFTGSCCFGTQDLADVLVALGEGRIKVDDLITARIALKDVVEKGLKALRQEVHHVKILVDLSLE